MPNYGIQLAQASGAQAAGGIINEGMGLLTQGIKNKQQQHQARALQDIELEGEATRMQRQFEQQMKLWEATGYGAQVNQMDRAGINPALMYGMGGGGGQTANTGTVGGSTAQAETAKPTHGTEQMGLMLGQMGLMQAQKENIEASTAKMKAETAKTSGVDTEEGKTRILNMQKDIEWKGATMEDRIDQANTEAARAIKELDRSTEALHLDRETRIQKGELIRAQVAGQWAANELVKAETAKTGAQTGNITEDTKLKQAQESEIATAITKMITEMGQKWYELSLEERRTAMTERLVKFNTAQSQRIFDNIIKGITTITTAVKPGPIYNHIGDKSIVMPPAQ